ncbi:MAG: hypothetical protein K2H63_00345 [Paramuribaculum sp.]|nr:hypothetical protein [Paramuribaculum sp.]
MKLKELSGLPVVLIFFKSQLDKLFNIDTLYIDQLICVRDTPMTYNVPPLYPYEEILFPIQILNTNSEKSLKAGNVLVYLGDSLLNDIQMYQIIRLLNGMTQFNITLLHKNINIESICNNHISVTDHFDKIDDLVESSSCVVGSGVAAILALMRYKPLVIIGDTGYGGSPTCNNLLNHRKNYFQGAIGSALGSPISNFLLYEDLEKILNNETQDLFLKEEVINNLEKDKQQIRDVVYRLKHAQNSKEYKLNTNLEVRKDGDFGIIIQRYTNQLLAELDFECLNTLKGILEGQSLDNLNQEAIQLLIENNIIVKK